MQATWDKILRKYDTLGHYVQIQLADGVYTSGLSVTDQPVGNHLVTVRGNCSGTPYAAKRSNVVIRPPSGTAAFEVQDLSILAVKCLRVEGSGVIGFHARQHVVFDIDSIDFGSMSIGIAAQNHATVNLTGDNWITGSMTAFIQAVYHSHVRAQGANIVQTPVNIEYFLQSYTHSSVEFVPGTSWTNYGYVTGNAYYVWRGGSLAANGIALPGSIAGTNVQNTGFVWP